jgi:hypothetical protein
MKARKQILHKKKIAYRRFKKSDYEGIAKLDDYNYIVTDDYSNKDLLEPIVNLEKLPLWDWIRLVNTRKNTIYYTDFSVCIGSHKYIPNKESLATLWSFQKCNEVSIKTTKIHMTNFYKLDLINTDRQKKLEEYYLENNDWDLSFSDLEKTREEITKLMPSPVVVSKEISDSSYSIVISEDYKNYSISDIYKLFVLPSFYQKGKIYSYKDASIFKSEIEVKIFCDLPKF